MMAETKEWRWLLLALSASVPVSLVVWSVTMSPAFTMCVVSTTAICAWIYRSDPGWRHLPTVLWRVIGIGALAILGWLGYRYLRF